MTAEMLAFVERAREEVRHSPLCNHGGKGDAHCDCGAVEYLDRLEAVLAAQRPAEPDLRAVAEACVAKWRDRAKACRDEFEIPTGSAIDRYKLRGQHDVYVDCAADLEAALAPKEGGR